MAYILSWDNLYFFVKIWSLLCENFSLWEDALFVFFFRLSPLGIVSLGFGWCPSFATIEIYYLVYNKISKYMHCTFLFEFRKELWLFYRPVIYIISRSQWVAGQNIKKRKTCIKLSAAVFAKMVSTQFCKDMCLVFDTLAYRLGQKIQYGNAEKYIYSCIFFNSATA